MEEIGRFPESGFVVVLRADEAARRALSAIVDGGKVTRDVYVRRFQESALRLRSSGRSRQSWSIDNRRAANLVMEIA